MFVKTDTKSDFGERIILWVGGGGQIFFFIFKYFRWIFRVVIMLFFFRNCNYIFWLHVLANYFSKYKVLAYCNVSIFFQQVWNSWFKDLRKWRRRGYLDFCCFFSVTLDFSASGVNFFTFSSFYSFHGISWMLLKKEVPCQQCLSK